MKREPMHVKYAAAQNPPDGVVWKLEERGASSEGEITRHFYVEEYDLPLRIEVSTRTSHLLVSNILKILLNEVIGYPHVYLIPQDEAIGDNVNETLRKISTCFPANNCSAVDVYGPEVMINVEVWLVPGFNLERWVATNRIEVLGPLGPIGRLWQRFQDDGNVSRCYSIGRPRITTPNEDRYLVFTSKRNRRSTASDLSRQLSSATGTTVSRQTVYRHLGHIGLYARTPVRCVPLTATHCRLRLTWSREHALRTPQQWSCVMFSGESRFSLQSDSRRTLIWRASGTRYNQENTIERHLYGGAGWLVWERIILGSRTDLHVQSVTMTGHIYRDVILEQHIRLFLGVMGAEFLFMDDNALPRRANIVDECLQSEDITRMD
ncbi:transposable element Tcb1 transposase [Trichonephila clavipes]|nr:transposable element Tcb1 transposase [Trichonephila clavipes]